jgi:hypothetical protein
MRRPRKRTVLKPDRSASVLPCGPVLLLAVLSLCVPVWSMAGESNALSQAERNDGPAAGRSRQIRETLEGDPRFRELLEVYPELRLAPRFVDEYDCWIVEFIIDKGEVGMATVSPDGKRILEFGEFDAERPEPDDHPDDRGEGGSLWAWLRPEFSPAALFWLALILTALAMADFRWIARYARMPFAVDLDVVGMRRVEDLLDHLRGRVLADLRVVTSSMKIEVNAKETVGPLQAFGRCLD